MTAGPDSGTTDGVPVVRTPADRFRDLPDYPYSARTVTVAVDGTSLRLAHVDEGDGPPVVLLHGEPTWGYLYRHVIPPLLDAGLRAIVPDLPGFGRSDKPADRGWFSYDRLVAAFAAHLDAIGLAEPITLVVHDWGGPIGMRWAVEHPDLVARLVILDTALYAPGGTPSEAWQAVRRFVADATTIPAGAFVDGATGRQLTEEEQAAYEAPFAEEAAYAGAVALPLLVPLSDDDPGAAEMWATNQALTRWEHPTLIVWGEDDPILRPRIGRRWADTTPGCVDMVTIAGASHFLQEDAGREIGARIAAFVASG